MYVAACRETGKFILAVVEDAWVRELRDPDIFYAAVLPRDLLDHLQLLCGGLHALDVLALQNDMQRFHLDAEGMPEYINALKDAQKQSRRANHDITNATLLLMATNAIISTQRFPRANERWEEKTFQADHVLAWKVFSSQCSLARGNLCGASMALVAMRRRVASVMSWFALLDCFRASSSALKYSGIPSASRWNRCISICNARTLRA